MGSIDSDKVHRALKGKMKAEIEEKVDRVYYIYDEQGDYVSSTSISQGPKETLRGNRVAEMKRQLGLDTSQQLIDLVQCRLSRKDTLEIMQRNRPSGTPRRGC